MTQHDIYLVLVDFVPLLLFSNMLLIFAKLLYFTTLHSTVLLFTDLRTFPLDAGDPGHLGDATWLEGCVGAGKQARLLSSTPEIQMASI